MPLSNARKLIVGVTAGLALVAATAGITYSATTGSTTKQSAVVRTFPTSSTTGVPPLEVSKLTAYTGPTTITSCGVTIDHKIISEPLTIHATNGTTQITNNEALAKANACVIMTNDVVAPTASSCSNCGGINTAYTSSSACKFAGVVKPCGPLYVADTEVSMPVSQSGYTYGLEETNIHAWRVYSHGTSQGVDCDGFCEFHDSFLVADRVDQVGKSHMDGFISNGNSGNPILLDHDSLLCQITNHVALSGGGCSGDIGLFGDFGTISNITVTNSLMEGPGDAAYCAYTGASQPSKQNPTGNHLTWTNNVWQRGPNSKCGTYGPVADWQTGNGNISCNNIWDDGTTVIADSGNCSSIPTTTSTAAPVTTLPPTTLPAPPPTSTTSTVVVGPTTTTTKPVSTTTTTKPVVTTTTTVPVTPTTECLKSTTPKVCTVLP